MTLFSLISSSLAVWWLPPIIVIRTKRSQGGGTFLDFRIMHIGGLSLIAIMADDVGKMQIIVTAMVTKVTA
jgi:hypothetical protein